MIVTKIANLLLLIVEDLEKIQDSQDLKNKKVLVDLVAKILPTILTIQDIQNMGQDNLTQNDLDIINNFLSKNKALVAREGFEPPTNGL